MRQLNLHFRHVNAFLVIKLIGLVCFSVQKQLDCEWPRKNTIQTKIKQINTENDGQAFKIENWKRKKEVECFFLFREITCNQTGLK